MKFSDLKAIAHNLADSAADGLGFMIGMYSMDVFGEAAATVERYIEVDFLTGQTTGGKPSASLAKALELYSNSALPNLCQSHRASPSDFRELKVRFVAGRVSPQFEITIQNQKGRREVMHFEGLPARRVKALDHLGRPRRI